MRFSRYFYKFTFSMFLLEITLCPPSFAQPRVKLQVELNPTGSFTAQSTLVNGSIQESNGIYSAKNISFDLGSLKTGVELRDKHMKTKYFEVEKFPKATLVQGSAKAGKFSGDLNLHGVTRPVSGTYEIKDKEIIGKFKCTLSEFKIQKANYMGVGVEDSVDVEVILPITKK